MLNSKARKRKRHVDDSCPAGTERETDDEGSGKRPTICTCLFLATVSPLPGRERPLSKVTLSQYVTILLNPTNTHNITINLTRSLRGEVTVRSFASYATENRS